MKHKLPKVLWLSLFFFKKSYIFVFVAVVFRAGGIACQATSISLLVGWLANNVPEVLLITFGIQSDNLVIPLFAAGVFFLSSVSAILSKIITLRGVHNFEKYIFLEKNLSKITIAEFGGLTKVLLAVVDSIMPLVFLVIVCFLWILKFPILLPVMIAFILSVIFLGRSAISFVVKSHRSNVDRLKSERSLAKEVVYSKAASDRALYKMIILPQYLSIFIYFVIAALLVTSIVMMKQFPVTEQDLLSRFLPIGTLIAALQLKSIISLITKVGIFSDLIGRIKGELIDDYSSSGAK